MSTTLPLTCASTDDLYAFLAEQLAPRLRTALEGAGPEQRLRVTTLPLPVMARLAEELQDPRWVVVVLANTPARPWEATAGRVIELRNTSRPPLLVFLPPGPRTASEDSIDIATFTELSLAMLSQNLSETLLLRLPEGLRREVADVLGRLTEARVVRNYDEQVHYLLTVLKNGATAAAAGGAIFAFGLIPDLDLFVKGSPNQRWTRNRKCCEALGDVNRPLQTRLQELKLKPNTLQNALWTYLRPLHADEPRVWSQAIACDPDWVHLSFDRWEFADAPTDDELRLVLDPLSLPRQAEDQVAGAEAMAVLDLNAKEPLKVSFRSMPTPNLAPTWKTWRAQILAVGESGATVAWESNNFPKPAGGRLAKIRRTIKIQDLQALDEGTYFLRVDAYDADGAQITTHRNIDPAAGDGTSAGRLENESEPFLLLREGVVEPPEARATFVPSLLAAWAKGAVKALDGKVREPAPDRSLLSGTWNQPSGASVKGDVQFALESDGFVGFSIVVPGLLRKLELAILDNPKQLGLYSMSFVDAKNPGDVEIKRRDATELSGSTVTAFVAAREAIFNALLHHHIRNNTPAEERPSRRGVIEVVDLSRHAGLIEEYVDAYLALAADSSPSIVQAAAWLDVIELRWRRAPGDPGHALLLSPTHPLRVLWHLRHTEICDEAVRAWQERTAQVPKWRRLN